MKESNYLPKVLSISLSTWREDSGIHTQTDLFTEQAVTDYASAKTSDTGKFAEYARLQQLFPDLGKRDHQERTQPEMRGKKSLQRKLRRRRD